MRICIISHDFHPNIGGIAAHVVNLAQGLVRKDHSVCVVSIRYKKNTLPFFSMESGVAVYRFLVPNVSKLRGISFMLQAIPYFFVRSIFRPFDVVHWHNLLPDSFIGLSIFGRKKIFTNHSSNFLEMHDKNPKSSFWSFVFSFVDCIIAPSLELRDTSISFFTFSHSCAHYISNGVRADIFRTPSLDERTSARASVVPNTQDSFVVLCPRRLEPKNGVEFFVRAAHAIIEKYPQCIFIVTGNDAFPDYASSVKKEALSGPAANRIVFTGPIPNAEMIQYYWASDVVVLPSLMEATSISGLEAMSCGLPLIGTRVGGIPQIINDKQTGRLVSQKNPKDIVDAIDFLIHNHEALREYGACARARIEKEFSWDAIIDKTLEIYK